jgi:GxxExxY protein
LLESIYKECLKMELERARLPVEVESPLTVTYKGASLAQRFRVDLLVDRVSADLERLCHPDLYNRKFGAPGPERE